jgi:hypothetical protein
MYVAPGGYWRPRVYTCVSHAKSSLRKREFRGARWLPLPGEEEQPLCELSYQVSTRGEDSIGSIGSSLEAEFPQRRKFKRPRATSTAREVPRRVTGVHSNDQNELKYESVFDYHPSRGILRFIAITLHSRGQFILLLNKKIGMFSVTLLQISCIINTEINVKSGSIDAT